MNHHAGLVGLGLIALGLIGCEKSTSKKSSSGWSGSGIGKLESIDSKSHQTLADDQLLEQCDLILDTMHTSGVSAAFSHIRKISPLIPSELDEVEQTTESQINAFKPRFGDIIGYERVSSRHIGSSVAECVYILKFENHILRWRFYFYKPEDKWFLNSFNWDDRIQDL